jgi:hypothetical protein
MSGSSKAKEVPQLSILDALRRRPFRSPKYLYTRVKDRSLPVCRKAEVMLPWDVLTED